MVRSLALKLTDWIQLQVSHSVPRKAVVVVTLLANSSPQQHNITNFVMQNKSKAQPI